MVDERKGIFNYLTDVDFLRGVALVSGLVGVVYLTGTIMKETRESRLAGESYQSLPEIIRKHDNSPQDGFLDADELTKLVEENEIKKR